MRAASLCKYWGIDWHTATGELTLGEVLMLERRAMEAMGVPDDG